ncbi:polysaccharide deacetylase family protein [Caldovatus aquaticus]|uniref:Chitooligosaccharide deacetylase n=1 Tax=Caldovatus aquaticus TaxID=2865671 RepID=A0ABS7F7C6_9PROT|nr:polysaccharide deacetylase family protein [Caldovatus aquaticus]MBW8271354.1 polysaccharide deacetylase family protein [Caldovatus aquaticus]
MQLSLRDRIARKLSDALAPRILVAGAWAERPRGVLSVSFDDFPKTAWEVGGPVLDALGVRATYYVSGALCGRSWNGVQQYDEDDLVAAFGAGHEIACHTYDHLSAARNPTAEYLASIARNGRFLRERLPGWVGHSFSYPWGAAPLRARHAVSPLFGSCRSTIRGLNGSRLDRSLLRAVGLERCRGRGADIPGLIAAAAGRRAWLILYTHDVRERPSDYGCTPAELEDAVRRALAAGLEVRPVASVLPGPRAAATAPLPSAGRGDGQGP